MDEGKDSRDAGGRLDCERDSLNLGLRRRVALRPLVSARAGADVEAVVADAVLVVARVLKRCQEVVRSSEADRVPVADKVDWGSDRSEVTVVVLVAREEVAVGRGGGDVRSDRCARTGEDKKGQVGRNRRGEGLVRTLTRPRRRTGRKA